MDEMVVLVVVRFVPKRGTWWYVAERVVLLYGFWDLSCREGCVGAWVLRFAWLTRLGKNKLHKLRGVQLFFGFSAKLVHFSDNFWSLNGQRKNNFKNIIFIACKWCKIWKYYLYSLVISLSLVKRKKKNAFGLNIWFTLFCHNFNLSSFTRFFHQIWIPKISEFTKKCFFFQVCFILHLF